MNIKTRTTNFEMTPAIEAYVEKRISSLEKFLKGASDAVICEVELGKTTNHHKSGEIFKAEINMVRPGGDQLYAVAEKEDLYSAIDVVRDEVERKIVATKEKKETLFRRGASKFKSIIRNFKK
ncbi:MAG: ribosome-associated translation inhibitor RaiA [Patescibacteria group bacterium]